MTASPTLKTRESDIQDPRVRHSGWSGTPDSPVWNFGLAGLELRTREVSA